MSKKTAPPAKPLGQDWSVAVRVFLERDGQTLLGRGRLELLEGIRQHHSISAAARQMGMSYRRAWQLVQRINEAAGEPFVLAAVGGEQGGGARLTPHGEQTVTLFRELQQHVLRTAALTLPRLLAAGDAATVHVAAASSLEEVLGQLSTWHALRQPPFLIRAIHGASDELADLLLAGTPVDLFLTADPAQIVRLEAAGRVPAGSSVLLAENTLAALGPEASTVRIRRPADLTRAAVQRIALADPASPLGRYTADWLERAGLAEAVRARAVLLDNSRTVIAAVRSGEVEAGLVYGSDAVAASGCRILFHVRDAEAAVRYAGVVLPGRAAEAAARQFLGFLVSEPARRIFQRCGLKPNREE